MTINLRFALTIFFATALTMTFAPSTAVAWWGTDKDKTESVAKEKGRSDKAQKKSGHHKAIKAKKINLPMWCQIIFPKVTAMLFALTLPAVMAKVAHQVWPRKITAVCRPVWPRNTPLAMCCLAMCNGTRCPPIC